MSVQRTTRVRTGSAPPWSRRPAPPWVPDALLAVTLLAAVAVLLLLDGDDPRGSRRGAGPVLPGPGPLDQVHLGPLPLATVLLVAAAGALALRRRCTLTSWAVGLVLAAGVVLAGGNPPGVLVLSVVSLYTVGAYRSLRTTVVAALASTATYAAAVTSVDRVFGDRTVTLLAFLAAAAAVGVAVRSQRAAVAAAETRAQLAERTREEEAQRRVSDERVRIARELHDVLAHHVSVINVQAGVARHLLTADPAQAENALGLVRGSSRTVLAEMRTVLGLLRTGPEALDTQPAPSLTHVADLVDTMTAAGLQTTWRMAGEPSSLGEVVSLTAYRLVQESLTNALKHGSGTAALEIVHTAGTLLVHVTNPVPAPARPGSTGLGLIGMRERVASVGGTLTTGASPAGTYTVHAELPRETS